ncbi:MAG: lysophospholipid acyltransferase family protein [Crocinitomicaceae bacterium]|nr:lysophospholipid acyltransferase family protein [Crocinitomicaceae bacterium]
MEKWDGKTKGSLWGYKFFVFIIRTFGIRFSYFFCYFVSFYYVLFAKPQKEALIQFYTIGFGYSRKKAKKLAFTNFYNFGQTLIDRVAMLTNKQSKFTHTFNNEKVLRELNENKKGGILISGHVGNWENAGNLIHSRITNKINIVMLDAEVEKVKAFMETKTGGSNYNIIPIKDDMSHLILIHRALKRSEFVALHADRVTEGSKNIELNFLNSKAEFPMGPFILAQKFKAPITFVYAAKANRFHYNLYATDPLENVTSEMEVAKAYVKQLEKMVTTYPTQWFNFYKYYADK